MYSSHFDCIRQRADGYKLMWKLKEEFYCNSSQNYGVFSLEDTNHCESTLKLAGSENTTKSGKMCVIIVKYVSEMGNFRSF